MNKSVRLSVAMIIAAASLLVGAPAAYASDFECRGTVGSGTVVGNLIVPDDATCTIYNMTVQGSIVVKSRATLYTDGPWGIGITVTGGIQGESPAKIVLTDSSIGNSVSVRKGGPITGQPGVALEVSGTYINGDVALEENVGSVSLANNRVVGSIQANKNTGGLDIRSNEIGNGLQCQDNNPFPTGGDNIAKQMQGQCVGFDRPL